MKPSVIHEETSRYKVETQGNGAFVTLTRKADNASVFIQGEDAAIFLDDIDCGPNVANFEDWLNWFLSQWDDVMTVDDGVIAR